MAAYGDGSFSGHGLPLSVKAANRNNASNYVDACICDPRNPRCTGDPCISSPHIRQAMFSGVGFVDAGDGHFTNVAGDQSNTYHNGVPTSARGPREDGPYLKRAIASYNVNQTMFENVPRVDTQGSQFANVGGHQSNVYGSDVPNDTGSESGSSTGRRFAETGYDPSTLPNAAPNPYPSRDGQVVQTMFRGVQKVDARDGLFANIGGDQSNTYQGGPHAKNMGANNHFSNVGGNQSNRHYGTRKGY